MEKKKTTCKQNVFKRKRKENHAAKFCRAPCIYTQCNLGNYCKVYKYISLHRYWFSIGFCNNWTRIQNNCQHWNGIGIGCIASSRLVTHTDYFVNNQTYQTSVCARRIDDGIYINQSIKNGIILSFGLCRFKTSSGLLFFFFSLFMLTKNAHKGFLFR